MKKLTFEKAVLIVLVLIIIISTADTTSRYILSQFKNKTKIPQVSTEVGRSRGFAAMLSLADKYYKERQYEDAAKEYYNLTLNAALTPEQKAHSNFRLGLCQYKLQNYALAAESFKRSASFSMNDSIAYNNAAVSAYLAKDTVKAMEYQKKALELLPAVEYYFNLARMYEDSEQFDLAALNYLKVVKAEHNITEINRIDPVRVKDKVARLSSNSKDLESTMGKLVIALKLKDTTKEVLTINDKEMQLKQGDFIVKIDDKNDTKNITAEYNSEKNDPYNLITEVAWRITKNGRQVYKTTGDKLSFKTAESGNYQIDLDISYSDNLEKNLSKTVTISNKVSTVAEPVKPTQPTQPVPTPTKPTPKPPAKPPSKTYEFAVYEQLFESDFNLSGGNYRDKYNVVWGKDSIDAQPVKEDTIDKLYNVVVINNSGSDAGIWANFDALIKKEELTGKPIRIGFYAKRVTDYSSMSVRIRLKTKESIINIPMTYSLSEKWEEKVINLFIPAETTGLTISFETTSRNAFKMDGFTIIK